MSTKNDPGKFDCYANAAPDEPMFVLLGRDRHAPLLVRIWVLLRHREGKEDDAKLEEAVQCAAAMEQWQLGLGKKPFDNRPAMATQLLEMLTDGLNDHPPAYDDSCICDECIAYGE
jgi:hypothetical protein